MISNVLTVGGLALGCGALGAFVGATIGTKLNDVHDDLGMADGLSLMFGGVIGLASGIFIGAVLGSFLV